MSVITNEKTNALWKDILLMRKQNRGKTGDEAEIAISYIYRHQQFGLFNKGEMNEQMRVWRELRKQGLMKIKRYNSKTAVVDGVDYHFLVAQPYKNGKISDSSNLDPMGLFILGEWVNGWIYAFTNKGNRDAVEKYVMGKYDESLDEECDDESDDEVEVNCICDKCFGEGTCMVSAERAKELKEMELMEECCPYGDRCNGDESDDEEED